MNLSSPKQLTFIVALVLGLLGLLGSFMAIPFVSEQSFWFVFVGFAILVAGVFVKDL